MKILQVIFVLACCAAYVWAADNWSNQIVEDESALVTITGADTSVFQPHRFDCDCPHCGETVVIELWAWDGGVQDSFGHCSKRHVFYCEAPDEDKP